MIKLLFDWVVDPLGLPIDWGYEFILLLIIDGLAYTLAFEKVGVLKDRRILSRGIESKLAHWILRIMFFFFIWAIARLVIWLKGFVVENIGVSIFALACIIAIIITVKVFNKNEENKRLKRIRVRVENRNSDKENTND